MPKKAPRLGRDGAAVPWPSVESRVSVGDEKAARRLVLWLMIPVVVIWSAVVLIIIGLLWVVGHPGCCFDN